MYVAAALDAQAADYLDGGGAQHLIFLVGERLAGGDYDAVAGVNPHRVQVFHIADGDAVVGAVADYFVLDFFPADEGTFQEYLGYGAGGKAGLGDGLELGVGVGDAAAAAAEGVGRADNQGQAHTGGDLAGFGHGVDGDVVGFGFADFVEEGAEKIAIFGAADGFQRGAQQADVVAFQDAGVGQGHGEVESGLAAEGGEQAVGPLAGDDALQDFDG